MSQDNIFNVALREIPNMREFANSREIVSNPTSQIIANRKTKSKIAASMTIGSKRVSVNMIEGWQPLRVFHGGKYGYDGEFVSTTKNKPSKLYDAYSSGLPSLSDRESLATIAYFIEQALTGLGLSGESMMKLSLAHRMVKVLNPKRIDIEITLSEKPKIVLTLDTVSVLGYLKIGECMDNALQQYPESKEQSVTTNSILSAFAQDDNKSVRKTRKVAKAQPDEITV